ncbi:Uncharacterized metal-binding protein [Desulfatibacillum alkenivorans DSM 16219]|jgi:uncharacterized metal-binding protein|uniref:Uncharacterized metal-binding protein n=1 Tax=Desulfatibacillum alkenivorans DSM 16219 TaxID=1121393 RepID=A0A1M6X7R0_9BACT|nr:DUF1847 domain-containing protein [Desulfatibacillum alkenivorans]SHL01958.1 Uncharacterized metal-binding protein [Desulfatibacillum alkenivorans DSM 16219]
MTDNAQKTAHCALCEVEPPKRSCLTKKGKGPTDCPTLTRQSVVKAANQAYENPEILEFARQASIQEAECYANRDQKPYVLQPSKTRIVEVAEFAKKMEYKRLGLAFCLGLMNEAKTVSEIFEAWGFEMVSVICKAGRTSKKAVLGLEDDELIRRGSDESACNPVFQAELLNHENTEFNILLGLCVGHDSLFFQHAKAPTTVLAVKDRVTGHNPLAAVYGASMYYQRIKVPGI